MLAKASDSAAIFLNLMALPYMVLGAVRNLVGQLGHWNWRSLFVDYPQVRFTSLGNPYVLHEMPHLPNLLAVYCREGRRSSPQFCEWPPPSR